MADSFVTIPLNRGLDLVTPPLMAEPGSLIDCLNYELTDIAGYRRIDGYERYDGYPNGAIYEYFRVVLSAVNPSNQEYIVPGSVITRTGTSVPRVEIGTIVSSNLGGNTYDIIPNGDISQFSFTEYFLLLSDGESFLELQDDTGLLRLSRATGELGATFNVETANGEVFEVTVDTTPVPGRNLAEATEYLNNIRTYSAVLRQLIQDAPTKIAGLHWFKDRLLAAVNLLGVSISVDSDDPQPTEGTRLRWNGTIYRLINAQLVESGDINTYRLWLSPISTSLTVDDNLVGVAYDGTPGTTWLSGVTDNGNPSTTDSLYATIGYYNNPSVSAGRGFTYLPATLDFLFEDGASSLTLGPQTGTEYVVESVAGTETFRVKLEQVVLSEGEWGAGTAKGRAQLSILEVTSGNRDYLIDGDKFEDLTGTLVFNISSTPTYTAIAGTGALDAASTRYVWDTYNFYGQSDTIKAYGATGASRAFWADSSGFGLIWTQEDSTRDVPKYVSYHGNKLVLAYSSGSVLLSVLGLPYNFSGLDGAIEIPTGDDVTGLLELPGDTLAVFGRRSIRRIDGSTSENTSLKTIAANTGCFDYTAVLVGQEAIFASHTGISTLQQTAAYGDFIGSRVTDDVSTWLRPKLVKSKPGFELGGTICAYPVRSKSQYRLVLATGQVVTVTFTKDGNKITFQNPALTGQVRIPYVMSSQVADDGLERIHTVWTDSALSRRAIELDTGWGFDGRTFTHYFDIAHVFNEMGTQFSGIEKVRLYGQGYGVATLNVKSSGIETDFRQDYHSSVQDISMPVNTELLYDRMQPVTSIIDQANWGIGVKLRIQGTTAENTGLTEPAHICQAFVLHTRSQGAIDG